MQGKVPAAVLPSPLTHRSVPPEPPSDFVAVSHHEVGRLVLLVALRPVVVWLRLQLATKATQIHQSFVHQLRGVLC